MGGELKECLAVTFRSTATASDNFNGHLGSVKNSGFFSFINFTAARKVRLKVELRTPNSGYFSMATSSDFCISSEKSSLAANCALLSSRVIQQQATKKCRIRCMHR